MAPMRRDEIIEKLKEREADLRAHPEQGRKKQDAAIAILDAGGMSDGMEQQTQRIHENVALLALDLPSLSKGCLHHSHADRCRPPS